MARTEWGHNTVGRSDGLQLAVVNAFFGVNEPWLAFAINVVLLAAVISLVLLASKSYSLLASGSYITRLGLPRHFAQQVDRGDELSSLGLVTNPLRGGLVDPRRSGVSMTNQAELEAGLWKALEFDMTMMLGISGVGGIVRISLRVVQEEDAETRSHAGDA